MKKLAITVAILTASFTSGGQQGNPELQKQVDELKARVKQLEKENIVFIAGNKTEDSLDYALCRAEIYKIFLHLQKLDGDYQHTSDKLAVTGLFSKLIQAGNPTSDILGFRFTDVIMTSVDKHFIQYLKDEKDKKRLINVIGKIMDNPVVSNLANTNPVTSVIASVIHIVSDFSTTSVELKKNGRKVTGAGVNEQDIFDSPSIKNFRASLQIYIDFYDVLNQITSEFVKSLDDLNKEYHTLNTRISLFKSDLYNTLNVNDENLFLRLSQALPDPSADRINNEIMITRAVVKDCYRFSDRFAVLREDADEYEIRYKTLLYSFLDDYIKTLGLINDFPDSSIDKSRARELADEIKCYIKSRKLVDAVLLNVDE
ncbi:MAG TPA: hypothetical protein PLW31_09385 [Bacteroidales bacterium]|nr:hypothetical protein [Bacteroidales bacterium]HOX78243.1 hypothetical protein [Bacteroidales bacterium]HPI86777.1 hypothetical protein [Bacteroidales bacterium]HPM92455.1 hypothetical protein [Bacteroidales bacterium]